MAPELAREAVRLHRLHGECPGQCGAGMFCGLVSKITPEKRIHEIGVRSIERFKDFLLSRFMK